MDVLFLSLAAGAGHTYAALSIKEHLDRRYPKSRNLIIDTLHDVNPVIDKLIIGGYLNTVKLKPGIYGKLYSISDSNNRINNGINYIIRALSKLTSKSLKRLIDEINPAVIVCTHPIPLQMAAYLKKKQLISVPVVSLITDYLPHSLCYSKHVDAYIVAHEYMKTQLALYGISPDIIYTFGIPVSSKFQIKRDRNLILNEFNLEDKTTALIMGGSLGYGEISNTFTSLLKCKTDLQIVAVAGNNIKLKDHLERISLNYNKNVKIVGFTDKVNDLMDISNCIITKPGGMTVTEALVKELPLFIISPIPGQEEQNAHFLINSGVACRILPGDDMDSILFNVLNNPLRIKQLKEMCKYYSRPDAAVNIVKLLDQLANKKVVNNSKLCVVN